MTRKAGNMKNPLTVTIPDAVRLSGCSRSSLYEAMRRGELAAKKAGRRTLIRLAMTAGP